METIRVRFLAEFLNEMVACEQAAAAICRTAISRTPDVSECTRLEAQESECRHHERILDDLIAELAGEVAPPTAAVRTRLGAMQASLADVAMEPEMRHWLDLQTLLDCETICQRNWAILAKIGECNGDPAIEKAVGRVGNDENRHVQYLRDALFSRAPEVMLSR